jgi:hypothetical protein
MDITNFKQGYCKYTEFKKETPQKNDYVVDIGGSVEASKRDNHPSKEMPPSPPNGGLYGGPQTEREWGSVAVTPTATNYIYNHLRSANPPPGATTQYVSLDRFGNNYSPVPDVKWYNPTSENLDGMFNLKGV